MEKHASQSADGCLFAKLEIIKPSCEKITAFEFKSYKIVGGNLTVFTSNPTTIVGASVLELTKFHM